MTRCLQDQTLWLMREGESRPEDQAHLRACLRCAARYDRLVRDLHRIEGALRAAPAEALRPAPTPRSSRLAVAAALVAALALGAVQAWRWSPSGSPIPAPPAPGDTLPFLTEVSAVLSPSDPAVLLSSAGPIDPLLLMEGVPDGAADGDAGAEPDT